MNVQFTLEHQWKASKKTIDIFVIISAEIIPVNAKLLIWNMKLVVSQIPSIYVDNSNSILCLVQVNWTHQSGGEWFCTEEADLGKSPSSPGPECEQPVGTPFYQWVGLQR